MMTTAIGSLLALLFVGAAVCIMQRAIGRQRRAEKLLVETNAKLATDLVERQRAAELLRARNEDLNAFAYTVSHDLKAPLRGIAGYAQELARSHQAGLGERARFCVSQILMATRNLDDLIEDLLLYSRLNAESPSLAEVNVPGLIDGILKNQAIATAERDVKTKIAIPFQTIRTWESGLAQVLTNLIDNALKYSRHARPPRIEIGGEKFEDAYRFSIADNGIGFDMQYHDRIFGLFNRLVRADEFEGTGAGLAITKKLLDKLGGKIWAESRPGCGATFFIELPRRMEPAIAP